MAIMHTNFAMTGLFEKVTVWDVRGVQEIGKHAVVTVHGMIPPEDRDSYILRNLENEVFSLLELPAEKDGVPEVLFRGLVKEAAVSHKGGVYYFELTGVSLTYLLDMQLEKESYQDIAMTFEQIIQKQLEGLEAQCINDDERKGEEIGRFTLKYNESRWDFTRRMASRHNLPLFPDIKSEVASFWVGLPKGRKPHILEKVPYKAIRKLWQGKAETQNAWVLDTTDNDYFGYLFSNRLERFELGDIIQFEGLTLRIMRIQSCMSQQDAVMRYDYLGIVETGCKVPTLYNAQIQGMSEEGRVIDRRKDFTKLHLYEIDEDQDVAKATWFRQPAYYTAGKDRGWCAMPELDDQMSLHFPTVEENDCYLLDSTQVPYEQINANVSASSNAAKQASGRKSDREIPASKYINAPNGQVMLLEDDLIVFHSKNNFTSMAMHEAHTDEKGMTLGITLRTKGDINLQAKNIRIGRIDGAETEISEQVSINSAKGIDFVCAMSSLIVDAEDGAHFKAPKVRFYPEVETMVIEEVRVEEWVEVLDINTGEFVRGWKDEKGKLTYIPPAVKRYAKSMPHERSSGEKKDPKVYAKDATDKNRLTEEQQKANAKYIYNYLKKEGWTDEAIAGLFGNIERESHFNPGMWQRDHKKSGGYGLVQWTPPSKFLDGVGITAKKADKLAAEDPQKLMDLQLDFLTKTMKPGGGEWLPKQAVQSYNAPYKMTYGEFIKSTKDPRELATIFYSHYERSASGKAGKERLDGAEKWYEYIKENWN